VGTDRGLPWRERGDPDSGSVATQLTLSPRLSAVEETVVKRYNCAGQTLPGLRGTKSAVIDGEKPGVESARDLFARPTTSTALRAKGSVIAAGRRVLRALVALPRQIVAVMQAAAGRSAELPDSSSRPSTASKVGRALVGLPIALGANVAALVLLFSLAWAVYYPFWAAEASRDALDRSWGGPSAAGATLVYWLVAAVTVVAKYGVILLMERLSAENR
jgi:hypothetical protein